MVLEVRPFGVIAGFELDQSMAESANFQKRPTLSELRQLRKQFAPNPLGKQAFRLIVEGLPCSTKIGEEQKECGERSVRTRDIDIFGNCEQFGVCSDEHDRILIEEVLSELEEKKGVDSYPSSNGWVRAKQL